MNTAKIITAFILSVMFIACGSTAESESKIIETQSSPVTAKELGVKNRNINFYCISNRLNASAKLHSKN